MTRTSTPKPADSAKPTTGSASTPTSNLFNAFQPSASTNAALYNPYNSSATNQALADQNNASYWAGQGQLQQAKEAASFGTMQGVQAQAAQAAQQNASQQGQQATSQLQSTISQTGIGQPGRLAFGGQVTTQGNGANDVRQRVWDRDRAREGFQQQLQMSDRDRYTQQVLGQQNAVNQRDFLGDQQRGERELAQIQGRNQLEAARIAANAQLGAAGLSAQSNMVSSLFGSLSSSIGGGGGNRYW